MMRGVACRLFAALLMMLAIAAGSARAEDDPAQKALDAARQLEARVNEDTEAPPEAYLPVARLLRDIAQRYPGTPQGGEALDRLGLVCQEMKRYEEAAAVSEQVAERYPLHASNALNTLDNVIGVLPDRKQRREPAVRRVIAGLQRLLGEPLDPQSRRCALKTLAQAYDLVGDTEQAAACCRQMIAECGDDPVYAKYAHEYLEYLQTWPHVSLTEDSWVVDITNADDVTPETELVQKNQRAVNLMVRAPLGKQFASSLTFDAPAPIDATKPKISTETLPNGRTQAVWQATCGLGDRYLPAYSQYGGWAISEERRPRRGRAGFAQRAGDQARQGVRIGVRRDAAPGFR